MCVPWMLGVGAPEATQAAEEATGAPPWLPDGVVAAVSRDSQDAVYDGAPTPSGLESSPKLVLTLAANGDGQGELRVAVLSTTGEQKEDDDLGRVVVPRLRLGSGDTAFPGFLCEYGPRLPPGYTRLVVGNPPEPLTSSGLRSTSYDLTQGLAR